METSLRTGRGWRAASSHSFEIISPGSADYRRRGDTVSAASWLVFALGLPLPVILGQWISSAVATLSLTSSMLGLKMGQL
jgi:hypothetical protein